jgi:adenylate kinase|tara:strand:+ start:754 stop:1332 length:579 start_codon:yes stop_codon:yes gene_type:complete
MKIIVVTGTPGTGKTKIAGKIASKLNFEYIDVNKIIKKNKISEGYDKKRKAKIIDTKKLNKALVKEIENSKKPIKKSLNKKTKKQSINKKINIKIKKNNDKKIKNGIIVDSHLSHYLPKKYVDLCIVTKCSLRTLKNRLEKRRYSKKKIRENMDAEIFDVCLNEAKENKHKILVIDTTKSLNLKIIINKIKK